MTDIKNTLAFKSDLEVSLKNLQDLLPPSAFDVAAGGLRAEIGRLELEIEAARLSAFLGCDSEPVFPRIRKFVSSVYGKLEIPRSAFADTSQPLPAVQLRVTSFSSLVDNEVYRPATEPAFRSSLAFSV